MPSELRRTQVTALRLKILVLDTILWERNKLNHFHNKGFSGLGLNCLGVAAVGGISGFRVPATESSQELSHGGEGNPRSVKSKP